MYKCLNLECAKTYSEEEAKFLNFACSCGSEIQFDGIEIKDIMASANNLSPSIAILPKLRKLLQDDDADAIDIASLIQTDATLSARIIRHSNSGIYPGERLDHIDDAIQRIGFSQCFKTVGMVAAKETFNDIVVYGIKSEVSFKRSLLLAFATSEICAKLDLDAELGYLMGLTLKIGQLVINQYFVDRNKTSVFREHPVRMAHEQEVFGFTFVDVSLYLLREWNFADDVIEGIRVMTHNRVSEYRPYSVVLYRVLHDVNELIDKEEDANLIPVSGQEREFGIDETIISESYKTAFEELAEITGILKENVE